MSVPDLLPIGRVGKPHGLDGSFVVERGAELAVDRAALPAPREGEFYAVDLVGAEVVEEGGRSLGHVLSVDPYEANDVLALDNGVQLPMVEDCVLDVDLECKRIRVARGFVDES